MKNSSYTVVFQMRYEAISFMNISAFNIKHMRIMFALRRYNRQVTLFIYAC